MTSKVLIVATAFLLTFATIASAAAVPSPVEFAPISAAAAPSSSVYDPSESSFDKWRAEGLIDDLTAIVGEVESVITRVPQEILSFISREINPTSSVP